MLTKRVEVLFDPKRYALLEEIARARNTSVGALVRQAVDKELLAPTVEEKVAALNRLTSQEIDFGSWDEIEEELSKGMLRGLEATGY